MFQSNMPKTICIINSIIDVRIRIGFSNANVSNTFLILWKSGGNHGGDVGSHTWQSETFKIFLTLIYNS